MKKLIRLLFVCAVLGQLFIPTNSVIAAEPGLTEEDGKLHYYGYTDSLVLNGVLVVLFNVFNDSSPTDILSARFGFFNKLRIKEHLSSTRCVDVDIIIEKILSIAKSNL